MDRSAAHRPAPAWAVWAALLVVYLVWGSTYLAIAVVVQTMPPLLTGSVRFLLAGLLMAAFLALRSGPQVLRLSRAELLASAFVGLTLLVVGNGLVMASERDVASGLAALIIAVTPLWVIVLRLVHGEQIGRGTLLGVLAGFAGVAVLVLPRGMSGSSEVFGMLLLVVAAASWSVGSFYSKRIALPANPLVSTTAQMLAGGVGLAVAGALSGELGYLAEGRPFSTESVAALAYLVTFGSIVGYTAYTWLLQHAPVSKVATYAYVNPVVAIFLGWLVLHEEVGLSIAIGGALVVGSVGLVVRTEGRPRLSVGALDAPPAQSALARRLRPPRLPARRRGED